MHNHVWINKKSQIHENPYAGYQPAPINIEQYLPLSHWFLLKKRKKKTVWNFVWKATNETPSRFRKGVISETPIINIGLL